ncbi:hypothetical protein B0H13DRAFT_588928 [Mycena leptocephala]|nr:hypothetical protein B0H13DRAFT_588928 [Mycena leptocephala]
MVFPHFPPGSEIPLTFQHSTIFLFFVSVPFHAATMATPVRYSIRDPQFTSCMPIFVFNGWDLIFSPPSFLGVAPCI